MLQSDKVKSSEEGKIRLRQAYKDAGLTIEKLAKKPMFRLIQLSACWVQKNALMGLNDGSYQYC
jgi:hypothetical protein